MKLGEITQKWNSLTPEQQKNLMDFIHNEIQYSVKSYDFATVYDKYTPETKELPKLELGQILPNDNVYYYFGIMCNFCEDDICCCEFEMGEEYSIFEHVFIKHFEEAINYTVEL